MKSEYQLLILVVHVNETNQGEKQKQNTKQLCITQFTSMCYQTSVHITCEQSFQRVLLARMLSIFCLRTAAGDGSRCLRLRHHKHMLHFNCFPTCTCHTLLTAFTDTWTSLTFLNHHHSPVTFSFFQFFVSFLSFLHVLVCTVQLYQIKSKIIYVQHQLTGGFINDLLQVNQRHPLAEARQSVHVYCKQHQTARFLKYA